MKLNQLPILGLMQEPVTVSTTNWSSVSRTTLIEEVVILMCVALLATVLLRRGPRRVHLLLWGLVLMTAKDVVFHASVTFGFHAGGMWAANLANVAAIVGWLLIALYCLTLLWEPSANTASLMVKRSPEP
jgi:hypothetical protein